MWTRDVFGAHGMGSGGKNEAVSLCVHAGGGC